MMIYLFFQPIEMKKQEFVEVPLFNLKNFTMYELDKKGLKTILLGNNAKRFSDRYTVENINYTDSAKKYISNMKSNNGTYKDEIILLKGDVTYTREDGLTFQSEIAQYNKKSAILSTDTAFVLYKDKNSARGASLEYNNITNKIKATKIKAIYQLQESR